MQKEFKSQSEVYVVYNVYLDPDHIIFFARLKRTGEIACHSQGPWIFYSVHEAETTIAKWR